MILLSGERDIQSAVPVSGSSAYTAAQIEICREIYEEDDMKDVRYECVSDERFAQLLEKLDADIAAERHDIIQLCDNRKITLVFRDSGDVEACGIIDRMMNELERYLAADEVWFAGAGKTTDRIIRLSKAERMTDCARAYSRLGAYKLLLMIDDADCLNDYYSETIKPLDEYDRLNGGNLTKTLKTYLHNNGSVLNTADELHLHSNTINGKLKKIENILGCSLTDYDTRNRLTLGLMAKNLL